MNETRQSLGFGLIALVPIVCCIGLPLIAAAGIGVGLAARLGGIALAALVLITLVVLLAVRAHRQHNDGPPSWILRARS